MNPHLFRFEGRTWVSAEPAEQARAALAAQRAWDAQTARAQRWWVAIGIGAVVGTGAVLALGAASGLAPFTYLVLLPLGFGAGAVLGAVVNKRFNPGASVVPSTPRPTVPELYRVPPSVLRRIADDASAAEIIALVRR